MPLSLSHVADLATSPVFLARVTAAMARVGWQVGQEAGVDEYHLARRDLVREFARWNDDAVKGMAWLVAAQPGVTADTDDGQLVALVAELWSAAAGAGAPRSAPENVRELRA